METVFDIKFEKKLIKEYAAEIYEDFFRHAERRQLEPDFVIENFIKELRSLARKDGYIK